MHDVIFPFQTDKAFFFGSLFAAAGDEVVVGNDFGADEAAFDVGVDLTGCFLGFRAVDDGPGADFVRSGRKEVDQPSSSRKTSASSSGSSAISASILAETATT